MSDDDVLALHCMPFSLSYHQMFCQDFAPCICVSLFALHCIKRSRLYPYRTLLIYIDKPVQHLITVDINS